MTFRIVQLHFR